MTELSWLALALGAPLAFGFTFLVRGLARRRGWLDLPGPARLHARPVPRLGGVAMYAAFVVTVLATADPLDTPVIGLLIGASVLVAAMIVDDLKGLRPRDKFVAQLVAAAVPLAAGVRIDAVSNPLGEAPIVLPLAIVIPFTLFWIVGMMNAVNFMDGLDGLGAGVSVVAAIVLVALSLRLGLPSVATIALAVAAVALGFLPFNIFRASIIMGDSGSHFLGLAIAVVAILGPAKLATAVLVLGVPILDVGWSIVRRAARRGSIGRRDSGHLHHRLWEAGLGQSVVAILYYLLAATLGLIALLVERLNKLIAFGGLAILLIGLLFLLARLPRRRTIPRV